MDKIDHPPQIRIDRPGLDHIIVVHSAINLRTRFFFRLTLTRNVGGDGAKGGVIGGRVGVIGGEGGLQTLKNLGHLSKG